MLLLLFAALHTFGFQQVDPTWGVDSLIGSMRSVHFDMMGSNRTYWDLFVGFGLLFTVFLVFVAVLAWQLSAAPTQTLALLRGNHVGACHLLCVRSWREFNLHLYYPYRLFNLDHALFCCGSLAFDEASLI